MGARSSIEWVAGADGAEGATVNPIRARRTFVRDGKTITKVGWHCEPVHGGCAHCWAQSLNRWVGTGLPYKPGHRDDVEIVFDVEMALEPLTWSAPTSIFWGSTTDLYGSWVDTAWLDQVKAVQVLTPHHTHIELTKRPDRMRDYLADPLWFARVAHRIGRMTGIDERAAAPVDLSRGARAAALLDRLERCDRYPLPNVWAGPSCSTQRDADELIPLALEANVAVRVVSFEPLLSPIRVKQLALGFAGAGNPGVCTCGHCHGFTRCPNYGGVSQRCDIRGCECPGFRRPPGGPGLHGAFIGGESGAGARPFDLGAARELIRDLQACGVACFVKQLGRRPVEDGRPLKLKSPKGKDPAEWPEDLRVRDLPQLPRVTLTRPVPRPIEEATHG